jgi:hypothetical protein
MGVDNSDAETKTPIVIKSTSTKKKTAAKPEAGIA